MYTTTHDCLGTSSRRSYALGSYLCSDRLFVICCLLQIICTVSIDRRTLLNDKSIFPLLCTMTDILPMSYCGKYRLRMDHLAVCFLLSRKRSNRRIDAQLNMIIFVTKQFFYTMCCYTNHSSTCSPSNPSWDRLRAFPGAFFS